MSTITEYTVTLTEGSDVYSLRHLIMSDKTFFISCMTGFPSESSSPNYEKTFARYINKWVEDHEDKVYPIASNSEVTVAQVGYKNATPIFISHSTNDKHDGTLFTRGILTAIHPDERNKGLYTYSKDIRQYYNYIVLGADYETYEVYDSVVQIKKHQQNKSYTYLETLPAGIQGFKHIFKNTKEQYSQDAKYTFGLSTATYDKTNERYATAYIQSTYLAWDSDLS